MLAVIVFCCLVIGGKTGWVKFNYNGRRNYIMYHYNDAGSPQYAKAHITIYSLDGHSNLLDDGSKGKNVHAAYDLTGTNNDNEWERWYWDTSIVAANKWTKAQDKQEKASAHYGRKQSGSKYLDPVDATLQALYLKFFDDKEALIDDAENEKIAAHRTHYADYYYDDESDSAKQQSGYSVYSGAHYFYDQDKNSNDGIVMMELLGGTAFIVLCSICCVLALAVGSFCGWMGHKLMNDSNKAARYKMVLNQEV